MQVLWWHFRPLFGVTLTPSVLPHPGQRTPPSSRSPSHAAMSVTGTSLARENGEEAGRAEGVSVRGHFLGCVVGASASRSTITSARDRRRGEERHTKAVGRWGRSATSGAPFCLRVPYAGMRRLASA